MRPLLFFFLGTLPLVSCEKTPPAVVSQPALPVTTLIVTQKTIPADFEYVGVAQSSHPVEIRARVEGYLDQIAYQEGVLVKESDLLFQIDPRPFQASLDNAIADLNRTRAVLWDAERSVERLTPLYAQNAASRRDLDNAISSKLSSKAEVEANEAKVVQAQLNLGYTTIRSPITGLAGQSTYRQGSLITPGENGLLTTVSVIDPIWVNFNVSVGDILKNNEEIKNGFLEYPKDLKFTVEAILSNGIRLPHLGRVDFANPVLQQSTGTMLVRAVFENPEALLRPGQFVRAKAMGAIRPNAILVPQKAVLQGKDSLYVYVVNAEKKAEMRTVNAGGWYEKDWIIKSGLKPGEQVIVEGVNKVRPGMEVNPTAPEPPP